MKICECICCSPDERNGVLGELWGLGNNLFHILNVYQLLWQEASHKTEYATVLVMSIFKDIEDIPRPRLQEIRSQEERKVNGMMFKWAYIKSIK